MVILDTLWSTINGSRRWIPDPSPLKKACNSAYDLGNSAINSARSTAPDFSAASAIFRRSAFWFYRSARIDLPHRLSVVTTDPDSQKRIVRTAWNLLDYVLEHGTQPYTGGIPAYRILKEGLFSGDPLASDGKNDMNDLRRRLEKLEALQIARREKLASAETIKGSRASKHDHGKIGWSNVEDVIWSFIMSRYSDGDFIIFEQAPSAMDDRWRRSRRDFLLCKLN